MTKSGKAISNASIAVVAVEGCSSWITAGLLEMFAIANLAHLTLAGKGKAAERRTEFRCEAISMSGRTARGSHDVRFAVSPVRRRYDAIIVPPIWCESVADLERRAERLRSHGPWLQELARRSTIMASACSGAVLLANAGLLSGHRATTCWWLAPWFERRFPEIDLVPDRLVMIDGNRWTAAAGSAYVHLGLELVRKFAGEQIAAATARLMLVERRRGSQSPFLGSNEPIQDRMEAEVERAVRYIDAHLGGKVSVADVCGQVAVTERTLARKFQSNLGMSPLSYLQSRRMARAKQLLEDTQLPLESVVERCGYEDVSSFRKLFSRHVGMTPREYRSRFGAPQRGR